MITIEQVPMWVIDRLYIGHIVCQTDARWHFTACGSALVGGSTSKDRPKRICGKCRKALKDLTPSAPFPKD